jgi:starvation-inducible DNA-binding protein
MKKTTLHSTRNQLSKQIRQAVVTLLNQQLADVIDLGLQAKQAHWNVKGPNFIGLHKLFDEVAEQVEEFTDEIAERAIALGGMVDGTAPTVAKQSRLHPYPANISSSKAHVQALSGALAQFGGCVRKGIDEADKAGDADTADLLTDVSRGIDKLLWMVEAHGQSPE